MLTNFIFYASNVKKIMINFALISGYYGDAYGFFCKFFGTDITLVQYFPVI